jgi:hypothetical protein
MKNKLLAMFLLPVAALLLVSMAATGCADTGKQAASQPAPTALSSTLVPDVPMDLYAYARQENPTRVPLSLIPGQDYVEVESLAIWGVPAEKDFAIGMGLTMSSVREASGIFQQIPTESDYFKDELWKKLSGNVIYLVYGDGPAAESLKNALSGNKFKNYDNSRTLNALATMPDGGQTRLAGVALAEPTGEFLEFMANSVADKRLEMLDTLVKIGKIEIVAGGLYAPAQIDIVDMMNLLKEPGQVATMQLGMMVMMKSGYPGLVVEPIVQTFLKNNKFTETKIDDLTIYQGVLGSGHGAEIPVLVRIEGNYLYAALSGQESYARTLLTAVTR